jgi:hypothetical protein
MMKVRSASFPMASVCASETSSRTACEMVICPGKACYAIAVACRHSQSEAPLSIRKVYAYAKGARTIVGAKSRYTHPRPPSSPRTLCRARAAAARSVAQLAFVHRRCLRPPCSPNMTQSAPPSCSSPTSILIYILAPALRDEAGMSESPRL